MSEWKITKTQERVVVPNYRNNLYTASPIYGHDDMSQTVVDIDLKSILAWSFEKIINKDNEFRGYHEGDPITPEGVLFENGNVIYDRETDDWFSSCTGGNGIIDLINYYNGFNDE